MGAGLLKLWVSSAKEPYKGDYVLQKRPTIPYKRDYVLQKRPTTYTAKKEMHLAS